MLSAEVNSYLFNNARWLQPACECLSKSLLSITGSGVRNSTRQPRNALVSLHCQLSKRKKLPEEQSPFPAFSGCTAIRVLQRERAKLQKTWKTTTYRNIFSKGISNQQLYLQAMARKKIFVRRTKRNLTNSGHNLNLECQIWSTSNLELSLQRIVGEIF